MCRARAPSSVHHLQLVLPCSCRSLSFFPRSPQLLARVRDGSQILLDPLGGLGLLEQTPRSPRLWQLSYAQLYRPRSLLCAPWALFWGSPLLSAFGAMARGIAWQKPSVDVQGMVWAQTREMGAGGSRAGSPRARSADTEPSQALWGAGTPQSLGPGSCPAGWAAGSGSSSPSPLHDPT